MTSKTNVNVTEWMAMFREIGLNEGQMHKWHQLFETRHPAGHQSFLEWLGFSADEISRVRAQSR